ncbi:MAG: M36 family metallopeptidase [Verrucomicrobia bacterium]|nr:M36 family metallopeptidase [Verrucomicrobiota bacterium]
MSRFVLLVLGLLALASVASRAQTGPADRPDFDQRRTARAATTLLTTEQQSAAAQLRARVPGVRIDVDPILGSPAWIMTPNGFVTGPEEAAMTGTGSAKAALAAPPPDPDRPAKSFLNEHRALFGHGAEALDTAVKKREATSAFNGLRTTVWEQQLDGIPVHESVFIAHVSPRGEVAGVSSRFLAQPAKAADAGHAKRQELQQKPVVSAREALVKAIENIGETPALEEIELISADSAEPAQPHRFKPRGLPGEVRASLVWLPMERSRMRLCWAVDVTRRQAGETFHLLIDAETGEPRVRRCRTVDLSDVSYRVFTSDSPSPFSPGWPVPDTNQPPVIPRSLVTLPALSTNASRIGWISEGANETRGNNVEAHTDRNGDNVPDLPRPSGAPFRVFDFPLDLAQSPTNYSDAAVVQLFYWCNWMHDQLYDLGFTEEHGNFQKDNFGRGGQGGDVIIADAQDGAAFNNANFTTAPDGQPGRIQMFLFNGPTPFRDADLDAEVILHEYAHGLADRLIGGGVGISQLQTYGLSEGWSDFYALSLLSEPGDDVDGCYPVGGYMSYLYSGLTENYYYGIRRYPVSTDLSKNPLTFKDIDPAQASFHPGVPRNPTSTSSGSEVHRQGEVWCVTLWEARANLIKKYGFTAGNRRLLQLVTEGLRFSPPNPNFIQARDAILSANTDNVVEAELWAAFAKRGLGYGAAAPDSSTTTGVRESFAVPDSMAVSPNVNFVSSGLRGGPFLPPSQTYYVVNGGKQQLNWAVSNVPPWLTASPASGALLPGASNAVTLSLSLLATNLAPGIYSNSIRFVNRLSGQIIPVQALLAVFSTPTVQTDPLTQVFAGNGDWNLSHTMLTFTPLPDTNWYRVCRTALSSFPTDPGPGQDLAMVDDCYALISLTNDASVSLFGRSTNAVLIGSNGDLLFEVPTNLNYTLDPVRQLYTNFFYSADTTYFERHRVAPLYVDLHPGVAGRVSWQQLSNRLVVSWQGVPEYGRVNSNSFQVEWYFDGTIRFILTDVDQQVGANYSTPKVGLSPGNGYPAGFANSRFALLPSCLPPLALALPSVVTEGYGPWPGTVLLSQPANGDVTVQLSISDPNAALDPSSVVISNGQMSANFALYIPDDDRLAGTRYVTVRATAESYGEGLMTVEVDDATSAVLSVTVPARGLEGGMALAGQVSIDVTPEVPISVELSSSEPELVLVPASVIIPAEQKSAVFSIWIGDDSRITGPVVVGILVHVANWLDDIDAIYVADNETTNLRLTVPSQISENVGTVTNGNHVALDGTLPTNLVVSITCGNTNLVLLPEEVTIPAGQTTAPFTITVAGDTLVNGLRTVPISVAAPGFVGASANLRVLDDESPSYPTNPSPAHLAVQVPNDVVLQWDVDHPPGTNEILFDVYGGTNSTPGQAEFLGSTLTNRWPLPGLPMGVTFFWRVVAKVQNVEMPGPVWQFTTVALDHFALGAVASPQRLGQPFDLTVTAIDDGGVVASGFNGSVKLMALAPAETESSVVITEVDTGSSDRIEFISVSPREVDASGWQVVLYDWTSWPAPKVTYRLPAGTLCLPGSLFQVRRGTAQLAPGTYPNFFFNGSLFWNNNSSGNPVAVLLLDSLTNVVDFFCAVDAAPSAITEPLAITTSHWAGPPVAANENSAWTYQRIGAVDRHQALDWTAATNNMGKTNAGLSVPFHSSSALTVTPSVLGSFVSGVWTGQVAVLNTATNVFLLVNDGEGRQGTGNVFSVTATNDLAVSLSLSPGRKTLGNPFTYRITITNTGPEESTGVQLLDTLPASVVFLSATSSVGRVQSIGRTVVGELGALSGGATAFIDVSVLPDALGVFTNQAAVSRLEPEAYTANNTATLVSAIGYPLLSVLDASVTEGHTGATNLVFNIRLSEPSQRDVRVAYGTSDGTATADADYTPTAGVASFPPGTTNVAVMVAVFGDRLFESNDTVFVNLSFPTNALVVREQGTGTVTNDDITPYLTIDDVTVVEGDDGLTNALFTVTLSAPSGKTSSVGWATRDGSATAGLDYLPSSGRLVFAPGVTNLTVTVPVLANTLYQTNRTYFVDLTVPVNAFLNRGLGTGTILDDDDEHIHHFVWSSFGPTHYLREPAAVSLIAKDALNRTVTTYDGSVFVQASTSNRLVGLGAGTNLWNLPFGAYYHDARLQSIYTADEVGPAGRITSLALDVAARPGQVLSNFTLRLRPTPNAGYFQLAWETNWTTVYRADQVFASTGWVTFYFQAPFDYDGTNHLMVDFSFNNASYSSDGFVRSSLTTNQNSSIYFRSDSAFGDPLLWAGGEAPRPNLAFPSQVPNVRFGLEKPVPVTPSVLSNFVDGVWTGSISPLATADNAVLRATDTRGHLGLSAPFSVVVRDSDSDGISDEWETAHSLDPLDPADALEDPDHDGLSNLAEYLAGTDPFNPASAVRFVSVLAANDHFLHLSFLTLTNRFYLLEYATSVLDSVWKPATSSLEGKGGTNLVRVALPTNEPARFYRYKVLP